MAESGGAVFTSDVVDSEVLASHAQDLSIFNMRYLHASDSHLLDSTTSEML